MISNQPGGTQGGALAIWANGAAPTITQVPVPSDFGDAGIWDGACPAVNNCYIPVANFNGGASFVVHYDNGNWTDEQVPTPDDAGWGNQGDLGGISCVSTTSCVVVGGYAPPDGNDGSTPMIATLSNGKWTSIKSPEPPEGEVEGDGLSRVYCDTAGCVALGSYFSDSANNHIEFALSESGGKWTLQNIDWLSGDDDTPTSLVCTSSSFCLASLSPDDASTGDSDATWVDIWSDGAWKGSSVGSLVGDVGDEGDSSITQPYCTSEGNCILAGSVPSSPFEATLSNGQWTTQNITLGGTDTSGGIEVVTCLPSTTSCFGLGQYVNNGGFQLATVPFGDSSAQWTDVGNGTFTGEQTPEKFSLTCFSSTDCIGSTGVQDYGDPSGSGNGDNVDRLFWLGSGS